MSRIPLAGRRIWLTGASSGIGRACALEFARRGARMAISARNTSTLESLASEIRALASESNREEPVLVLPLDVRDRKANHDAVTEIVRSWGGLDTVVLNAGIREYVDEDVFDATQFDNAFATNFHGFVYGMEAALPELKRGIHPHLVGVSSAAAFLPLPRSEAYGASKVAVRYLLDSYRFRAESKGMWITCVHPGFVDTDMTSDNDFPMPFLVSTTQAARIIADGMERRRREIHFPKALTWTMKISALMPLWMYQKIAPWLIKVPARFQPTSKPA